MFPQLAPNPSPESLGSSGYYAICGKEVSQQPGYGTEGKIYDGFVRVWVGPGTGVGGGFAGCWGPPEVVVEPNGQTVAYDVGSESGRAMSLAITTSSGEAEIFLVDGNREAYAATLLKNHVVITGTQRYDLFNGDFQLIFTPSGTITTVRQVKHPTGMSQISQAVVELTEAETAAWLQAMRLTHTWLWPSTLPAAYGCAAEISFATDLGQQLASVCPDSSNAVTLTFAKPGMSASSRVSTVVAHGVHTQPEVILGIANQPIEAQ